jgi:SAM-dependent methyltransferase
MHEFDAAATARFFNQEFAPLERELVKDSPLRARDHLFLDAIASLGGGVRILDFGCGQGRLLSHLLRGNYDALGVEKHEGMSDYARKSVAAAGFGDRVITGGVEALAAIPDGSFDVVLMMGVLQYLSAADYASAIQHARRILRPARGMFYATFQNALFDLFTFNKYTVDFFMHGLCGPFADPREREAVERALQGLLTNPTAPPYTPTRARDNVFVRLTNPLTVAEHMRRDFGLFHEATLFYEWFGLPPLLSAQLGATSKRIAAEAAVDPGAWQGHFMANAFLASFALG